MEGDVSNNGEFEHIDMFSKLCYGKHKIIKDAMNRWVDLINSVQNSVLQSIIDIHPNVGSKFYITRSIGSILLVISYY